VRALGARGNDRKREREEEEKKELRARLNQFASAILSFSFVSRMMCRQKGVVKLKWGANWSWRIETSRRRHKMNARQRVEKCGRHLCCRFSAAL